MLQRAAFGADLGKSRGDDDHGAHPAGGAIIDDFHDCIARHGDHS